MAELSLKDRLQPALLDRLVDDERMVTVFRVILEPDALRTHGLSETDVERALGAQGLKPAGMAAGATDGMPVREYVVAGRAPSQLSPRGLKVHSAKSKQDVPLVSLGKVEASSAVNAGVESAERRAFSMHRLREAVLRDLGWLFNASGIDDVTDLSPFPEVQRSVLNYGLRSLAGRAVTSIDPLDVARRIRNAIRFFEPRLSNVRVTPENDARSEPGVTISFLVEAELWGQPMAQQLSLRTSIDTDTGDVVVADRAARS
jgi:type VI secretion system protein ImpF